MWQNAMLLECFCSQPCLHRWSRALSPVTLFALPHRLHFPSSLLLLQLRTFPSLRYYNLPADISEREVLNKPFKKEKKNHRGNYITLMCQSELCVVVAWSYHLPFNDWQFQAASSSQTLQNHITVLQNHNFESPGHTQPFKNQPFITGFFKCNFCKKLG